MIAVDHIDHLVITVASVKRTCRFYKEVLGIDIIKFGHNKKALKLGSQKINLQQLGNKIEPRARNVLPGSADICLVTHTLIEKIKEELEGQGIPLISGIVSRMGTAGKIKSIYLRDPDGNLIEISNYMNDKA